MKSMGQLHLRIFTQNPKWENNGNCNDGSPRGLNFYFCLFIFSKVFFWTVSHTLFCKPKTPQKWCGLVSVIIDNGSVVVGLIASICTDQVDTNYICLYSKPTTN